MILQKEREQVAEYGRKLLETGLVVGTFGNISVYNEKEGLMAISPSGLDYNVTKPEDIVVLRPDGEKVDGDRQPSSEYDLHRIFYMKSKTVRAVVHTHSSFATTLACLNTEIPPLHYLVAYAGKNVRCTKYVPPGTWELAEAAFQAMQDRNACLLGNHGLLAAAETLSYTFDVAEQIEFAAKLYCQAKMTGELKLLSDAEITAVLDSFKTYRKK